jgi:small subunit ribosomal protein S21
MLDAWPRSTRCAQLRRTPNLTTFSKWKDQTLQVLVRDNNLDQALRVLKKKMQREGVFREMKRHRFYEKPSEKATREKAEAIRRSRKLARKQAIREGLIAAPARKRPMARGRSTGQPRTAPR